MASSGHTGNEGLAARAGRVFRRNDKHANASKETNRPAQPGPPAPAADASPSWTAELRTARWLDHARLEITGWAYDTRRLGTLSPGRFRIVAESADRTRALVAQTTLEHNLEVNAVSTKTRHDLSNTAFRAVFDVSPLLSTDVPGGSFRSRWPVRVESWADGVGYSGPFTNRYIWGSAGELSAEGFGELHVKPMWEAPAGLILDVARRAVVAERTHFDGRTLHVQARVHERGFAPTAAVLATAGPGKQVQVPVELDGGHRSAFDVTVPRQPSPTTWSVTLRDESGTRRQVHWSGRTRGAVESAGPSSPLLVRHSHNGVLRIEDAQNSAQIEAVEFNSDAQPSLEITGSARGPAPSVRVELRGARQSLHSAPATVTAGRFHASIPLLVDGRWGSSKRSAPLPGGYFLWLRPGDAKPIRPTVSLALAETLYQRIFDKWFDLRLERDKDSGLHVAIAPPLAEDEIGAYQQSLLQAEYSAADHQPEPVVYFESYFGKSATCNTKAIYDEVVARQPDLARYWGVADMSVEIPDADTAVLMRSRRWWELLGRAETIVTNCWMPGAYVRRPHQTLVQTWHGTPLKLLGLDRLGASNKPGYAKKMHREVGMWSYLIAQNEHSAKVFREAYGFDGAMLEIGYPRNDVLIDHRAEQVRRRTRDLLGLSPHQTAILYAPTWRENQKKLVNFLDLEQMVSELGDDYVVLLRGHSNTLRYGGDVHTAGVLDVTTYPESADLYLAADVCITDYSSVMFDYTVTGKPILFFVPDLAEYRDNLRGLYFDLGEVGPGPLVSTTASVISSIKSLDAVSREYTDRYARWHERFNAWDDGHAARAVVDTVFGPQD